LDGRLGNRRPRSAGVSVLVLLVIAVAASSVFLAREASGSTSSSSTPNVTGQVVIVKQQFAESVPSYAILARNYTVRVVVQSNASIPVPLIIQLTTPVEALFVHPRVIHVTIQPNTTVVANFSMLPFAAPHGGPYKVTAILFVFFPLSMSSPSLVDQDTVLVSTIGPNPFPYLGVVLVSGFAVTVVLLAVFYPDPFRRAFHRLFR
jgi:hypothetical protein